MNRWLALVVVDSAAWIVLSVVIGAWAPRFPRRWVERDTALTALRPFEGAGRWWRRFGVDRWKDRLPEAGAVFGGASKRTLRRDDVGQLVEETRRAELVHWLLAACGPLFVLWNPAPLAAAMVAFAIVANAPFIVVQRYNRARLYRVVHRRSRGARTSGRVMR